MEHIIDAVNQSWFWLGPWLLVSLGVALVAQAAELVVKRRTIYDQSWKILSRHKTKKEIRNIHLELLNDPKVIRD